MKIIGIGTSKFLAAALTGFKEVGWEISGIISLKEKLLPDNSYNLKEFSSTHKCSYYETSNINSLSTVQYISRLKPDLIFSCWPRIITNNQLLKNFRIIGTHPTSLPINRGRHPVQWMITQGIKESKLSFFLIGSGIDTGNIILQLPFKISKNADINNINSILNKLAERGSRKIALDIIKRNRIHSRKQNNNNANYWRKKDRHDVLIDFRMREREISSIIRSFTLPYPCSFFIYNDNIIRVKECRVIKNLSLKVKNIEPGKIIKINKRSIIVKCQDAAIKLIVIEDLSKIKFGKYIFPPTKYIVRYTKLKNFFYI